MAFKNTAVVIAPADGEVTLYTCPAGAEAAMHTLHITGTGTASIKLYLQSTGLTVTIETGMTLPYTFPKAINLTPGDAIIVSTTGSDVTVVFSAYQSGGTGAAAGFNPRGPHDPTTIYNQLDVVTENGSSYVCVVDETTGGTVTDAAWLLLVSKGDPGEVEFVDLATVATTGDYYDLDGLPALGTAAATDATDYATAAQGVLADSALQEIDIGVTVQAYSEVLAATTASFTTADETKLDGIEAGADVTDTANVTAAGALMDSEVTNLEAVKGFDPADYATAAQGVLADSAIQSEDLATVATTGDYSDLNETPTLGTMAAKAAADYLPVAGGTMTGDLTVLGVIETGDASSATSYALDPTTNGTRATLTLTASTALTDSMSNGESIALRIIAGDTYDLTWVSGTLWIGGSAPVLTGDDRVNFEKWDNDLIGHFGLGIA